MCSTWLRGYKHTGDAGRRGCGQPVTLPRRGVRAAARTKDLPAKELTRGSVIQRSMSSMRAPDFGPFPSRPMHITELYFLLFLLLLLLSLSSDIYPDFCLSLLFSSSLSVCFGRDRPQPVSLWIAISNLGRQRRTDGIVHFISGCWFLVLPLLDCPTPQL